MKRSIQLFLVLVASIMAACGGGSSSSSSDSDGGGSERPELENVALQANGGVASANYDDGNADIVNDGNVTGSFWAGNADGDHVTVEFDQEYAVHNVTIYTNALDNKSTRLQVSDGGQSYTDIGYFMGNERCFTLKMGTNDDGNDRIFCALASPMDATHVRVKITTSQASSVQIHEIEAQGR